jgi:hypothetical protein
MTNVVSIKDAIAAARPSDKVWPDPQPLPDRLLPVPDFDLEMLPSRLGPWVEDISERLCIPPDFAGVASMVSAGAMIGSKIAIRPQEFTPWAETCNLFGVVIGNPSALKSPAIAEVLQPIRRMEARFNQEYQNELAHHEMEMRTYEIERGVVERKAKKLIAENRREEAAALMQGAEPKAPVQRRLLVGNATVEKMGEISSANPDGILIHCDEVVTLLNDLAQPEREMARGFIMAGWGGSEPYVFDRIKRGTIRIDRTTLSLIGTSQPEIWAGYLRNALTRRPDGMCQRIQMLAFPNMPKEWRNVDRPAHALARDDAFNCYEELRLLLPETIGAIRDPFDDGSGIPFLRFAPEAMEQWLDWRGALEKKMRDPSIAPAFEQHLGKYRGLFARLAGVCHLGSGGCGPVSLDAVQQAVRWMDYLEQHALRAYGSISLDANNAARLILRRIEAGQLLDGFTEKSIYDCHWSGLSKGPRLTEALDSLCEYDWLAAEKVINGGRPKTIYRINPKAYGR